MGMMYPLLALPPTPPSKRAKTPNDAIHSPRLICLAAKRPSSPGSSSLGLASAALVCNLFEQSIRSQLLHVRVKVYEASGRRRICHRNVRIYLAPKPLGFLNTPLHLQESPPPFGPSCLQCNAELSRHFRCGILTTSIGLWILQCKRTFTHEVLLKRALQTRSGTCSQHARHDTQKCPISSWVGVLAPERNCV